MASLDLDNLLSLLPNLIHLIPQGMVLAAAVYLVTKRSEVEGILMMVGSAIGLLCSLAFSFLPLLIDSQGVDFYRTVVTPISIVSLLGSLCFAIGLFLLVSKHVQGKSQPPAWTPPDNITDAPSKY